jgi:hypothetical protein
MARVIRDDERLPQPFVCFICETSPQREAGVDVVDTGHNFEPSAPVHITGRKLICSRCVQEFANLLGFRTADEVETILSSVKDARAQLQETQNFISSLAVNISEATSGLFNLTLPDITETSPVIRERKEKETNGEA